MGFPTARATRALYYSGEMFIKLKCKFLFIFISNFLLNDSVQPNIRIFFSICCCGNLIWSYTWRFCVQPMQYYFFKTGVLIVNLLELSSKLVSEFSVHNFHDSYWNVLWTSFFNILPTQVIRFGVAFCNYSIQGLLYACSGSVNHCHFFVVVVIIVVMIG